MDWRLPKEDDSVSLILENSHITDEALESYCLGLLDQETDVAAVEEHLLYCGYCQSRLENTQKYVDAAKAAAERLNEAKPPGKDGGKMRRMVLPIALAAALAGVAILQRLPVAEPVAVALVSFRDTTATVVPAGAPVQLAPSLEGLDGSGGLRYELANERGEAQREGDLVGRVEVTGLRAGRYWLRLKRKTNGELLREFALEAR